MDPERDYAGRSAVITGAARGLGRAFAEALAARGALVTLVDLDAEASHAAAAQIGHGVEAIAADVADEAAMEAVMANVAARCGGVDILINNAAIHSAEADLYIGALGVARTRRMFDVNVWGVIHCTLAARPYMAGRPGASIINIASMAAYGSQRAYGVTKLAVRGLTASFAHELGPEGIRVNAIAPGLILTDTIRDELPETTLAQVQAMQIIRRPGAPSDVVEAMLWLTSSGASFVTGETLRVSGGATLQI